MIKIFIPLLEFVVLVLSLTTPACTGAPEYPISGVIELHPGWRPVVYLVFPRRFNEIAADYLGEVADSAAIAPDGHFAFQHLSIEDQQILVTLAVQRNDSHYANHLSDTLPSEANYMPLVLKRDKPLVIQAQIAHFQKTFHIDHPSLDNAAIITLRDIRLNAYPALQSSPGDDSEDEAMLLEREATHNRYTQPMRDFADTTNSFQAALVAIRWVSPAGDFERIPEFLFGQCRKWSEIVPEHLFTRELCAASDKTILPVMTGDIIPDAPLPLVTGDTIMLHEMLGKRLTIVDIWASWCAPCRKENRTVMRPLWAAYRDRGLQIIGYSIDASASAWKAAIAKDGLGWANASHLTGDTTPFLDTLRITTIPANFILDQNGKVLAKNVFGEDLVRLVKTSLD